MIYIYKKRIEDKLYIMPDIELFEKLRKAFDEKETLKCKEFGYMHVFVDNYDYHHKRFYYYMKAEGKIRKKGAEIEKQILYDSLHIPPKELKYKHKYIFLNDDEKVLIYNYVDYEKNNNMFEYYD